MDAAGRIIAIIITIVMVVFAPLQYIAQGQAETAGNLVDTLTTEFTDTARHQGYITDDMYDDYLTKLSLTGDSYGVDLKVSHPVTGSELATADSALNNLRFNPNKFNNKAILLSDSHTHTDACFTGHRHNASCYGGIYMVLVESWGSGQQYRFTVYCENCNNPIMTFSAYQPNAVSSCTGVSTEYYYYNNGVVTTKTYNIAAVSYDGDRSYFFDAHNTAVMNEYTKLKNYFNSVPTAYGTGFSNQYGGYSERRSSITNWGDLKIPCFSTPLVANAVVLSYVDWIGCIKCTNVGCGLTQDSTPICDQVVTSITATNPAQTVNPGDSIITTATATFLDGHTGIVNCTVSGYNANTIGTQNVTLTYSGLVDNAKTSGTKTCTATVTVKSLKVPIQLTVTPSSTNVYYGNAPAYSVIVTYSDSSTATLSAGQYTTSGWSSGCGSKTLTFFYTENGVTVSSSVNITVLPNVVSLSVSASATTIYNGIIPTYTVTAIYEDNTTKTLGSGQYSSTGWSNGVGTKTVTFSYTENGITVSNSINITVLPNVASLSVSASSTTIYNGSTEPTYTVTVYYENGTSKTLSAGQYTKTGWSTGAGTKTVTFTYTENSITVSKSIVITVLPNIISLSVTASATTVYNGTEPTYTVSANYENGLTRTLNTGEYIKTGWSAGAGTKTVTFSYTENGATASKSITIIVLPNVTFLSVSASAITIYNGNVEPTYTVTANYENGTSKALSAGQYTKTGWSTGIGTKTVTFSYTENGITVSNGIVITVLPNVSSLSVTASAMVVYNGTEPTYTVSINYENGTSKALSAGQYTKTGWSAGAGTKTVIFSYTENGITVTKSITITVLPNVSSLSVTASATVVYNGTEPIYTVTVNYENGTSKTLSTSQYAMTGWSTGVGTKTVTFSYTENGITVTKSIVITVLPNIGSLIVTASATVVYNGTEPNYTVTVNYENGTSKTLSVGQYTKAGWSAGPGIKTVTFSYTENNITVTKSITITVLPNLSGLIVTPTSQNVARYTNPSFTVTALYEDGTSKVITGGYSITGMNTSVLGTQTVTISYTEVLTKSTTVTITVTNIEVTCQVCGAKYHLDENDSDNGCPVCAATVIGISASPEEVTIHRGETLGITVTATYRNNRTAIVSEWTSNFNPDLTGTQSVKITYGIFYNYIKVTVKNNTKLCIICGTEYELNDNGSDPGCPYCSKVVVSISASPKNLVMGINEEIKLTVMATYQNGITQAITGWYTNFTPDTVGTYEVSVFYKNVSDKITVTVINHNEVCQYCGLNYSRAEYPDGCPVCHTTLIGIKAALRDGGTKVMYRSDLNLEITLLFKDIHSELTYTGWTVSGYQSNVLGLQTVTVYYKEFSTTLTIEVVKNPFLITCPICGTQYYLNDDGLNPGCPACSAENDIMEAILYIENTYAYEILDKLYSDGIYYLEEGDYFIVTVTERGESIQKRIRKFMPWIGHHPEDTWNKTYTFGGEVII